MTLATNRLTSLEAAAREAAADEERKRQAAAKEEANRKEEEARKAEARRNEIEALKRPGSFETPTYRVTVESLERNANNYTATLVLENLTDETIKIAWQEKSNLVPDATGPYLIDESGQKYFAKGPDSGKILQDTMKFIWVPLTEILPKTKLTSRFLFIGNGNGSTFTLRAKELKGLGPEDPVAIEGLKIGNKTELPFPTPSVSPAAVEETSINAPVTAPTTAATSVRNLKTLSAAIERGEEVVFKIKYDYAVSPYHYLHDGLVSVSKTSIAFDSTAGDLGFAVNPDKILELSNQPQQASRVHLKVAIKNKKGDQEDKKDFDFYNLGAVTVGQGIGGTGLSLECNRCDDSMNVLYGLLQKIRSSSTTPSVDLAASVPGKYESKGRNYSDYLELKTDGTFSLYEKTRTLDGTYVVQGTILTFSAKGKYQYYLKARLGPLNELLVRGGVTRLRKLSFGKPDPWSDLWEKQP